MWTRRRRGDTQRVQAHNQDTIIWWLAVVKRSWWQRLNWSTLTLCLCGIHVHSMDLSLHCNVALCTLANGFSNTIARHKVPLFVVFYCSICFLLHIFAELRCVFQQRFQSNLWNFFSHHKCYRMDSCYGLSLRWTRGCRISRFAVFHCSYSSCGCCIISWDLYFQLLWIFIHCNQRSAQNSLDNLQSRLIADVIRLKLWSNWSL